jgi:hypothetical protein
MPEGEQIAAKTDAPVALTDNARGRTLLRRPGRAWRNDNEWKTPPAPVILSLSLVLLAAALLIGGPLVINPLLKTAADERQGARLGDVTSATPQRTFCRFRPSNDTAGELSKGSGETCAPEEPRARGNDGPIFLRDGR